jgi:ribosome maturation factor RimP
VSAAERVRQVVEPLLATQGLDLFDVELHGSTLLVMVERDGGVDLDAVTEATHAISAALDGDDTLAGPFVLEVSSPGVERPLRTPSHFRRAVGETITVKTRPGTDGERRVDGALETADEHGIVVAGRTLAYDDIERARTTFSWGGTPKAKARA